MDNNNAWNKPWQPYKQFYIKIQKKKLPLLKHARVCCQNANQSKFKSHMHFHTKMWHNKY